MDVRIAVLGAGINGLACAVKIKEKYNNFKVTVISSDFSPNTTGDGSGGLWYPYLCGSTPGDSLSKWGSETYEFLHQLWLEGGYGICLMPVYNLNRDKTRRSEPAWSSDVFGFHKLDEKEMGYLSKLYSGNYTAGHTFNTFVFSAPPFLSYLHQRFKTAHGEVIQKKVESLRDPILDGFDVIINCTGINARFLVPDDKVFSYRGQVIRVKAPWINQTVMDDEAGTYIIPNDSNCVLGGTHQEHDYNTEPYVEDTEFILSACTTLIPSLEKAEIYKEWVGLRPGRYQVRLEAEQTDGKLVIHNYGHGGCGLTLFWGCATNVLELLDQHMGCRTKGKSKL